MMSDLKAKLEQLAVIETEVPLSRMTTFHIGGPAAYVAYPRDLLALSEIIRILKKERVPYRVLGKGSNLLCADDRYAGVVIRLDRFFLNNYYENNELFAQAGSSIIVLAYDSMKKGLSGLEFASGIPGTVGGTVYMNAGAYKASMADLVKEVLVLRDGRLDWVRNRECGFSYRTSAFQKHPDWLIVAVRLQLSPAEPSKIRDLIAERRGRRLATQPLEFPSAGSIFRNPAGSSAWRYIDELGYRGRYEGGAQVSEKHPNFIINRGQATAKDVDRLITAINSDMQSHYGFALKTEVERFNWPKTK